MDFFLTILQVIGLAMSFKKIVLVAARLTQFFEKLIARPITWSIVLKSIQFYIILGKKKPTDQRLICGVYILTSSDPNLTFDPIL